MHRCSVVLFLACLLAPALAGAARGGRYDVSYACAPGLGEAKSRMRSVGEALGPRVKARLRVVPAKGCFAVVYQRRGSEAGAEAAAEAHSRILRRRGFGEAVPVVSGRYAGLSASKPAEAEEPSADEDGEEAAAGGPEDAEERQELEKLVGDHVKQLRRQGRLSEDERTAWSVYDFTTGESLVEINTDLKLQAGSLIKPFVALAFMHEADRGRLVYDAAGRARLERMIQHSDNPSTNWAMRRLGGPAAVQRLLKANYGDMLKTVEIVEYIPRSGRTYRNKASAQDYSRFLLALWKDELPNSAEIKRLMGLPKRDRLLSGTGLPRDTQVYSKTGSTSHLCGDMGVLLAKGPDGRQYPYALIGIIEKSSPARNYLRWLKSRGNVIREVSGLVFRNILSLHEAVADR